MQGPGPVGSVLSSVGVSLELCGNWVLVFSGDGKSLEGRLPVAQVSRHPLVDPSMEDLVPPLQSLCSRHGYMGGEKTLLLN